VVTRAEIDTLTTAKFAAYDADHNGLISRAEANQVRKQGEAALKRAVAPACAAARDCARQC
jgi:hypothetical protein